MLTAHMSTDGCEALSGILIFPNFLFFYFLNFGEKSNFSEISSVSHLTTSLGIQFGCRIRIWCQNWNSHSNFTETTHLHNFRLHAKSDFSKIERFSKSLNSWAFWNLIPDFFFRFSIWEMLNRIMNLRKKFFFWFLGAHARSTSDPLLSITFLKWEILNCN